MDIKITPGPLKGTVPAHASKSELHRMLICSAFSDSAVVIRGCEEDMADDILATVTCLRELGAEISCCGDTVTVVPVRTAAQEPVLECGESGSTLRFMIPVAAAACSAAKFRGRDSLLSRPIADLISALERCGACFSADSLPLIQKKRLADSRFCVPGNISSQYVSGLLMAGALMPDGATVKVTSRLGSYGYVRMTMDIMKRFGASAEESEGTFTVRGPYRSPGSETVGGDWSGAAALLAAAAAYKGSDVTVTGLDSVTFQADRGITEILSMLGVGAEVTGTSVRVTGADKLRGIDLDIDMIPDLFPVVTALCAGSSERSVFRNCSRLRYKESDRIKSIGQLIGSLGAEVSVCDDVFEVRGSAVRNSGNADAVSDHRVVMAAAVAAYSLGIEMVIRSAECINKSYPAFFDDLRNLGGIVDVV
ncbi:MAG: 3-phosphoshikimate 1-carboxyvinyltransferase [Oscillospiraceae bacterium]|nr:3-phosphoshikimate 1-carboxyvinyltransferase [Oscillospiraceae bacterium]